jgi:hypothetical protein
MLTHLGGGGGGGLEYIHFPISYIFNNNCDLLFTSDTWVTLSSSSQTAGSSNRLRLPFAFCLGVGPLTFRSHLLRLTLPCSTYLPSSSGLFLMGCFWAPVNQVFPVYKFMEVLKGIVLQLDYLLVQLVG